MRCRWLSAAGLGLAATAAALAWSGPASSMDAPVVPAIEWSPPVRGAGASEPAEPGAAPVTNVPPVAPVPPEPTPPAVPAPTPAPPVERPTTTATTTTTATPAPAAPPPVTGFGGALGLVAAWLVAAGAYLVVLPRLWTAR